MKPRVYSYIRFSSADQATGDSHRRQTDAATRFAASNGMEIDDSLTLQDLGRSAYAGHHVSEGALGGFLAACEAGLVPAGSILVVEAVDRLTRMDHLDAVHLIGRLVKHVDLHVVQLNRTFTNDIVRHDMGAIFTLIGAITLGHQESQQKSHRVGAAWEAKRKAAKDTGKKLTSKAPAWLKSTEQGFSVIPGRAKIVQDIFERFVRGESQDAITRHLNKTKVAVWGRGAMWNRSYVCKILLNEAVLGVLKMGRKRKIDAARSIVESVPDYYPTVIEPTLFAEAGRRMKSGTRGRKASQNPMQGILRCPHCGGIVIREWKGKKSRPKLVCGSVRAGMGKADCKTIRVDLDRFWDAFKADLADKAKVAAEAFHPAPVNTLRQEAETARAELDEIRAIVSKLDKPTASLVAMVAKLEGQVQRAEQEIREASRDSNLGWENLLAAIRDTTTTAAEMSARLRVVYPNGTKLDVKLAE